MTLCHWSTSTPLTLSSGRGTLALLAQPAGDPLPFKHLQPLPSSSFLFGHTSLVICSCHAVFDQPSANCHTASQNHHPKPKYLNPVNNKCCFCCRYLISQGANVGGVNSEGETPLDIAEEEAMEELLQNEINRQGTPHLQRSVLTREQTATNLCRCMKRGDFRRSAGYNSCPDVIQTLGTHS